VLHHLGDAEVVDVGVEDALHFGAVVVILDVARPDLLGRRQLCRETLPSTEAEADRRARATCEERGKMGKAREREGFGSHPPGYVDMVYDPPCNMTCK